MSVTKIGCEAYITNGSKILLGKRSKATGTGTRPGTWALPGGHLEYMERADDCIIRELKEEMDLNIDRKDVKLKAITDDLQPNNDIHYIHITFEVSIGEQIPKLMEPDECEEWRWFELNDLPSPVFEPHQKIFKTIGSSKIYI